MQQKWIVHPVPGGPVGKKLLALLWLLLVFAAELPALPLKIVSVDHNNGRIQVLLPIHHVMIEATLAAGEPEIRVRVKEFYEADLVAGEVDTTKRNYLLIRIPDQKPAKFRLRKISFLE
jgi:hypothetical protein